MKKKYSLPLISTALIVVSHLAFAGGAERKTAHPWSFYVGGFAAYYSANFQYGGNYFANDANNQVYNNAVFQQGVAGGGQLGVQYHLHSPYFLGLNLSAAINSSKARLALFAVPVLPGGFVPNLNHQFRIGSNVDMTGVLGADITPRTHLYAKIGASYAELTHAITGTPIVTSPSPSAVFARTQRKSLWGWIVGVGLTQDLSRWLNTFIEYDRYDYNSYGLNSFGSLFPGGVDHLTQHVKITAAAVRLGLNVKFMGNFTPAARMMITNPWLFYVGGFAAYYSADFQYGSNCFSNFPSNQVNNNTIFQRGVAGGGQLGIQYHLHSPYFFGFSLGAASNASKARLTTLDVFITGANPADTNHQFHIRSNVDMTGVLGADITSQTHLYAKIGASYAHLTHTITGTLINLPSPSAVFVQMQHKSLWGWLVGAGLTQDLNRWLSAFVEYDRYDYGNYELNSLEPLFPGGNDRLTQHMRIT